MLNRNHLLATISGLFALASFASAQSLYSDLTPHNIRLRLGVNFPADSKVKKVKSNLIALGLDYDLGAQAMKNLEPYISLEWFGKSTNFNRNQLIPICLNVRFAPASTAHAKLQPYFFAGVGAFLFNIQRSSTVLGARGGVGCNLTSRVFFEATGYVSAKDSATHAEATSVALFLGAKF